ncbi:unnamed protein product [Brassicogethes aeneus]|uniref:Anaphase-promoting complex subunit 4-like WD40 domain-containing protein n=1 Tax=Brassicogethes aeneus TaxID=1431903 RepID=A0A9P0FAL1_BRAAE|nr:unnamed protein product [Brassicogethes aeneus]
MSLCKIHNVRFYKPEARAIYNMAYLKSKSKLAVSRSDASLEIWDISHNAFIEKTIASTVENYSIEGLTWSDNRLFSVGLHGFLVEYDLYKLEVKQKTTVTGEAAFCMDSNSKNEIAVGTEQGYLNVFNVDNDEIIFEKFLDKQEGRIISLKFDPSGEFIVSGSIDAIRIWNVATGHALHKMSTGRTETKKPTIVWCLAITNDFTVISGDSRGKLTFWDGKVGAQIESYQSHKADILSICLSEDQTSLCCAGVDPNIINYVQVNVKGGSQKWVRSIQRKIHEHDIRSLLLVNQKLYSGGIDGYLACSYHPPKTLLKNPPLQNFCSQISSESRHILLRYPKHLEIYKLGQSEEDVNNEVLGVVPIKNKPVKCMVLHKLVEGYDGEKDREGICTSCISNNGKWVMFSTCSGTRLVNLNLDVEKPSLKKVSIDCKDVKCVNSTFTPDNKQLIVAPSNGGLKVYNVNEEKVEEAQFILFNSSEIVDSITHLTVSQCNKYLIAGDSDGNVVVIINKKNDGWKFYCKLPKYHVPLTALAVHPTLLNIVLTYADNKIIEYNIKKKEFTPFSRFLQKNPPRHLTSRNYPIRNVSFDTKNENVIILNDDSVINIIKKDDVMKGGVENEAKVPKLDSSVSQNSNGFYSISKYKHLVNLSWLSDDEMVAVEVSPLSLMENLPPAFVQNTFGRK